MAGVVFDFLTEKILLSGEDDKKARMPNKKTMRANFSDIV